MPPLVSHMVVARRVAAQLGGDGSSIVGPGDSGAYLLGATSPDIRVMTRWDRGRTHFFDLESFDHQDSVAGFFEACPDLQDPASLNEDTWAWTCGFLTHLIMDEHYIHTIYRPHFGVRSPLGGSDRANLLDRVLQYELDRREREDRTAMIELYDQLRDGPLAIECQLIDRPTLEKWRDVSANLTQNPPDWEAFQKIASRHLRGAGIDTPEAFRDFLERTPELLQEALRSVDGASVESFFEEVTERTVACLSDYLATS